MPAPIICSTTGVALTADEIAFAHQVAASFALDMRRGWVKTVRREDPVTGAIVEYHGYKDIAYVTPGGGIVGISGSRAVKWGLSSNTPVALSEYSGATYSSAEGIGKGDVIVGHVRIDHNLRPVIWKGRSDPELLAMPVDAFAGLVGGVSDSGGVIAVDLLTVAGRKAGRWTREAGMAYLPVLPTTEDSSAIDVSGDGSIVVGYIQGFGVGITYRVAVYWDSSGTIHYVYPVVLAGDTQSVAVAASKDGAVIVGWFEHILAEPRGFIWTEATGPVSLGESPLGSSVVPESVSGDGTVVVGGLANPSTGEDNAFRWTAETGVVDLGYLSPGDTTSVATGVSADGRTVVGLSGLAGANKAFKWTAATGMVELTPLPGDTTAEANAIS